MLRTNKETGRAEVKTVQYFVSGEWQWIRCCDLLGCRRFRKLPKSSNYSSSAMQKSEARPSPAEFRSSVSTDWTKAIYSWTLCLSVCLSVCPSLSLSLSLSLSGFHSRISRIISGPLHGVTTYTARLYVNATNRNSYSDSASHDHPWNTLCTVPVLFMTRW